MSPFRPAIQILPCKLVGRGKLKRRVLLVPRHAQPSTARSHPANPPSSLVTGGKPKRRTGQASSQRSTFSTCICLLFIKPSLLEHLGDSNLEISGQSVSFPHGWEQIILSARLSHYLLPAFHTAIPHAFKHTGTDQRLLHSGLSTNHSNVTLLF